MRFRRRAEPVEVAGGPGDVPWDPVAAAGISAIVDSVAAEVVSALHDADVEPVLLKGPVLDRWLYERRAPRIYADVDLLVGRSEADRAGEVLAGLGFAEQQEEL